MVSVAPTLSSHRSTRYWTAWSIIAAFGAYFCMYAFRKPFTAAEYAEPIVAGVDFKTILLTAQTLGYMLSKFIGIKVVAEMPPHRRAAGVLVLVGIAQAALLFYAVVPKPYSAIGLFFNGLPLGMVFGLVLGFLEGRKQTEFLMAGLCASFILADGATKSLGAALLNAGVLTAWMPFAAGLVAAPALVLFVWMLSRIPAPSHEDVAERTERVTMNRADRRGLYARFAAGLTVLVGMYVLVTIVRSIRADFAPELWRALGAPAAAQTFTYSEIFVSLGVLATSGAASLIRDNRRAFFTSLATCAAGFTLITLALVGQQAAAVSPFVFMVLVGLGLYLPYVAVHTTIFERLLAMTRQRGTIGYLMYVADAFGYLGYVGVMFSKHWVAKATILPYFLAACWITAAASFVALVFVAWYFARGGHEPQSVPLPEGAA